jgi:signal transduction histidine kinase
LVRRAIGASARAGSFAPRAAAEEVKRLLDAQATPIGRLEPDGSLTIVASSGNASDELPVSSRLELGASMALGKVMQTGRSARVVAASDETRRTIERDLHDGAQQRLVAAVMTLKLASLALRAGDQDAPALVTKALDDTEQATVELRELAQGILPSVLRRGGLPRQSRRWPRGCRCRSRSASPWAASLAVLDGQLRIESPADGGTLVADDIPLPDSRQGGAKVTE